MKGLFIVLLLVPSLAIAEDGTGQGIIHLLIPGEWASIVIFICGFVWIATSVHATLRHVAKSLERIESELFTKKLITSQSPLSITKQ